MSERVVIIGASHWHAPRYRQALVACGAAIVGVADADAATATRVAAAHGCPAFTDHQALLAAVDASFALVLPRHVDAPAVAADVLDAGLPMLLEKPGGVSADAVAALAAHARQRGAYVAVPFVNRYSPLWEHWRRLPRDERRPLHAHFRIINGPPQRYARAGCGWMLDPHLAGGGPLRNLGVHAADALVTLVDGAVDQLAVVDARLSFAAHAGAIEDYATALIAGPDGFLATVEVGYTFPVAAAGMTRGGDSEWRVATAGRYLIDRDDTLVIVGADGDQTQASPSSFDRYGHFVSDALTGWRRGERPPADLDDCWKAMTLIDAIYQAAGAPWLSRPGGGHHA